MALKELEEAHVIRREDRGGTTTHELTHDRFIKPIQKSNDKWLARYQQAERVRAKLEEYVERNSDEPLDELELREAEEYLNSPEAKILGATQEARQLVTRSRKQVDEAKSRLAEELEEARHRAEEGKQLRSELVKLLLEKRKRTRIFVVTVFLLGIMLLIAVAALWFVSYRAWRLSKQKAADLERQRQTMVERGQSLRENTKSILANGTDDLLKDVTALRNLSLALNLNRQDTEAAKMGSGFVATARLISARPRRRCAFSEMHY